MKTKGSPNKQKRGVDIFSNLMLMKFRPKTIEGSKKMVDSAKKSKNILSLVKNKQHHNKVDLYQAVKHIRYLELASKDSVILGDYNQLDMIGLQGLTHRFVDTFHYWSLSGIVPILDMKVNIKQQVFLVLSIKKLLLYSYSSTKRQKNAPMLQSTMELRESVKFMQFSSTDSIALFYENYFEIYSLHESRTVQKRVQKKYNVDMNRFCIFAVPQSIDNTINIFLQEKHQKKNVFGLWCIQINSLSENVKQNQPYKIYDIMNSLKQDLILENYQKDVIFLNLGQEILVAKKGYIVDSVNINIKLSQAYLRYLPMRRVLVHVEKNMMQTYSFKLNMNVLPHRIELTSIDYMQIVKPRQNCKLISILPIFQTNYAVFYEENSKMTTKGEIFYSFMVSYTVNLQDKVNLILATEKPISSLSEEELQQICDILRKIGMKDRQIYLEMWRRSSKSSIKDYQLLLSTRHYKTIKNQIQNKLRKISLPFKQVYKVEQSCLQILRKRITEQKCDQQDLQDFLTCHLLKRKLDLHKQLQILNNARFTDEDRVFYINIQDYYNLKNMELKQFVLESISQFLYSGKQNIKQIRVILLHFRFVYRFIYLELLEEIVKLAKNQLRALLVALPQLLPFDEQEASQVLNEGVWKNISVVEWQHSLYKDNLININNKQVVLQMLKGVWFRRNWLTIHDVIPFSEEQISLKNKQNNSVDIFYLFIDKVLANIKQIETLKQVLSHVQLRYGKYPQHLRNKVLLYSNIYDYYLKNYELAKLPKIKLAQLLTYKDYNLFKLFFDFQKVKKNCLLKQIIPIYQKSVQNGFELFNQSLFNYFKSDVSEISHLKYLLNRINNQKKEFHANHESMYYVLVKAMQIKLKIGSDNDIPVDQVLIYIQNIPIASYQHKQMIKQLQTIQKISDQSNTFKKMKINMTLREIIDKYEEVMEKLVDYQIEKYEIMKLKNRADIISKSYRVLAQIQSIKNNLYGEANQLAFFIYLTRLMQHEDKISVANDLLNDQYLNKYYYIDLNIIQNLVRYMYKWKFSQNAAFLKNADYIKTLLDLLADDNGFKQYALLQLKFAELLSSQKDLVTYPLSTQSKYPRLCELQQIIKFMDEQTLKSINLQEIVDTMKKLQQLSNGVFNDSKTSSINLVSISSQKIQDYTLYQVVIKVMITRGMLKEVLPHIRKSIAMTTNYDVITIPILIYTIIPQLNEHSKILITKITALLYSQPERLLEIVENVMSGQFTGLGLINFLKGEYEKCKEKFINFDPQNIVFNVYFTHLNQEGNMMNNKRILVKNTLIKLKKTRPQFLHDFLFDFLYIILCYQPQAIAIFLKFVDSNKYKLIRNLMSHLIQEQIFDEINILQVMRRVFYYLLKSIKENIDIYSIVRQYGGISLLEQFKIRKYEEMNDYQKKVEKNIIAFQRKKAKVYKLQRSQRMKKLNYRIIDKEASIQQSIKNLDELIDKEANQYIFSDSDNDYELDEAGQTTKPLDELKRAKRSKIDFDPMSERKKFYKNSQGINSQTSLKSPIKHAITYDPSIHQNLGQEIIKESLQKSSKVSRRYFGNDVRSGYDPEENHTAYSGIIEKPKVRINGKQSMQMIRQHNNQVQNVVDHLKTVGILQTDMNKKQKRDPSTQSRRKKVNRIAAKRSFDQSILVEQESVALELLNKKSQQEKNQKNEALFNSVKQLPKFQQKSFDIQIDKKHQQAKIQKELQRNEKSKQINKEELKPESSPNKIMNIQSQKMTPIKNDEEIKIKATEDVYTVLRKIYKTFNPRLQAQPYNLRALAYQKGQNTNNFKSILRRTIEEAYNRPQKSFQIALRLIQQIAEKYPEAEINKTNAEAYQRIAKYESKYGLDLPLQEMLPMKGLFLKKQDLFESIKENILEVCDHQNLFKIAKLISIGFKKNTLQQEIITGYLQKAVKNMTKVTDIDDRNLQLYKIKALTNKLTGKVLLQKAQQCIKLVVDADLKKRVVQMFAEFIKVKGNAKQAKQLANKYK